MQRPSSQDAHDATAESFVGVGRQLHSTNGGSKCDNSGRIHVQPAGECTSSADTMHMFKEKEKGHVGNGLSQKLHTYTYVRDVY